MPPTRQPPATRISSPARNPPRSAGPPRETAPTETPRAPWTGRKPSRRPALRTASCPWTKRRLPTLRAIAQARTARESLLARKEILSGCWIGNITACRVEFPTGCRKEVLASSLDKHGCVAGALILWTPGGTICGLDRELAMPRHFSPNVQDIADSV